MEKALDNIIDTTDNDLFDLLLTQYIEFTLNKNNNKIKQRLLYLL